MESAGVILFIGFLLFIHEYREADGP